MKIKKVKTKKPNRKALIRKLDRIVSERVRSRNPACVICGSTSQLTAGHLFSRRCYSTRWDFKNVWTQCWPCNYKHVRDQWPFIDWFIQNFSLEELDVLRAQHEQLTHFKDSDLKEMLSKLDSIGGE